MIILDMMGVFRLKYIISMDKKYRKKGRIKNVIFFEGCSRSSQKEHGG